MEAKLASGVSAFTFDLREPGLLFATAELQSSQNLDTARAVMLRTIDGAVTTTPTAEEVERAKNELVKGVEQLLDNSEQVGYALTEAQASGDWRLLHISRDRLKSVTAADVQRVVRRQSVAGSSRSTLAAQMKSLTEMPPTEWVLKRTVQRL